MIKKFIFVTVVLVLAYGALVQWKLWFRVRTEEGKTSTSERAPEQSQRVYSFSFSKYANSGDRELEIQGESANILTRHVALINVIAKAFAEETAITITADQGTFDKMTSNVHLRDNVVATTEDGARLITEQLMIHPSVKSMETDLDAKVKKDNIDINGTGAKSDSEMKQVTFKKNVTVVIQDPNNESMTPTVITSDGPLEIDYERHVAHFSQNVEAQDERGVLHADYMDVYYDKDENRVVKIVARGHVVIESKEGNTTYSDSAVYLAREGRIILGGDVEAQVNRDQPDTNSSVF